MVKLYLTWFCLNGLFIYGVRFSQLNGIRVLPQVVAMVRKFKRVDRSIVGAFSTLTTNRLRERAPELQRIFSARETLALYLGFLFGLLPFMVLLCVFLRCFKIELIIIICITKVFILFCRVFRATILRYF